jgi:hypothetical protein
MHAHARLGSAQPTVKGWHTVVDQLITFNCVGTTLKNLGGGDGPVFKIANVH